ncbi:MAG: UDP-N-acetylglucosamine 2-epimerase (non-hydrolyzing) [Pelagibacteraceae bacterium]|jgi:UDP-N-acetylglucosamine 2-epimerase|nr:UDP-N-acetylglucosamine 2-epimerase (non-hydrolyzing) [Pelagibacteraceae bacterium]MBT7623862.1 UDP-N-acetylglucosamine 2-epimerase (non-hydrolyzing) [Flavobacteriaceae bacterium]
MKTKVMTIVGTRPEIIKLSRVISELDKFTNHVLVHTGQNYDYELNEIFFEELKIRKPNHFLDAVGKNPAETISKVIYESDIIIEKEKPDAILLYGDTNSCLSVISAKRKQVPIFHMEAGNRCFDQRVPEEINRKIVDHLSDINMPLTEHARNYLISEGIDASRIIKTGSCMKEILNYYNSDINKSKVLLELKLKSNKYFLVSIHREENVDYSSNLSSLLKSLNYIAEKYKFPVIVSTHPRTKDRITKLKTKIKLNSLIQFLKPLGFFDYIKLQKSSFCVISDSGTITEESSILKFPAIMIRQAHERPEGMDEATVIMSGIEKKRIEESINVVTQHFKNGILPKIIDDYNVDNVSQKVVKIILSYIDYVNRNVWRKDEATKSN